VGTRIEAQGARFGRRWRIQGVRCQGAGTKYISQSSQRTHRIKIEAEKNWMQASGFTIQDARDRREK